MRNLGECVDVGLGVNLVCARGENCVCGLSYLGGCEYECCCVLVLQVVVCKRGVCALRVCVSWW